MGCARGVDASAPALTQVPRGVPRGAAGSGILSDLRAQREVLARSKAALDTSDVDLDRGRRLLRSMAHRAQAHRAATTGICVAVVVFFAFLMFWQGGGASEETSGAADSATAPP